MEKQIFKDSRNVWDKLKSLRTYLYTDVVPTALGIGLLHVAYTEYEEFNRPNVAVWYLVGGVVLLLYMLFRFWIIYKRLTTPRITYITMDEKGLCIEFNRYPYKAETRWEDVEHIKHFLGKVDYGVSSTVEYFDYTDVIGRFKDYRGMEFNDVIRIMKSDSDWMNEQEETVFSVLLKLEGSKAKMEIIGEQV